jgi:hypothetical protein
MGRFARLRQDRTGRGWRGRGRVFLLGRQRRGRGPRDAFTLDEVECIVIRFRAALSGRSGLLRINRFEQEQLARAPTGCSATNYFPSTGLRHMAIA